MQLAKWRQDSQRLLRIELCNMLCSKGRADVEAVQSGGGGLRGSTRSQPQHVRPRTSTVLSDFTMNK